MASDDYTIIPPLPADALSDTGETSARDRRDLPSPVAAAGVARSDRSTDRAAQEAADLAERRQRAPLIAYGGNARRNDSAREQTGVAADGERAGGGAENNLDRATAAVIKAFEKGNAGSGSAGGTDGAVARSSGAGDGAKGDLSQKLTPTTVALVSAASLPNRDLLITQGTFINCTLETALDSTIAGFTRCVTTIDVSWLRRASSVETWWTKVGNTGLRNSPHTRPMTPRRGGRGSGTSSKPSERSTPTTRSRVAARTPSRPLRTRLTVGSLTPASAATCFSGGRPIAPIVSHFCKVPCAFTKWRTTFGSEALSEGSTFDSRLGAERRQ